MDSSSLKVAIVGLGGLGCPALLALVEAWPVFKVTCNTLIKGGSKSLPSLDSMEVKVFDPDTVDLSNLNRQILFNPSDIGLAKAELGLVNLPDRINGPVSGDILLVPIMESISCENIDGHLGGSDLILDCTDSVSVKLLLNDFSVLRKIPLVYSGVQSQKGIVLLVAKGGPCLRCAFGDFTAEQERELGDACRTGGIIGASAALAAFHQVSLGFNVILNALSRSANPGGSSKAVTTSELISIDRSRIKQRMLEPSSFCPLGCSFYPRKTLDLRDIRCPETFLYTKLSLEQLDSHDYLEILFASIDDQRNVEHTIRNEGHPIYSSTLSTTTPGCRTISGLKTEHRLNDE